jgi:hypothetical protein
MRGGRSRLAAKAPVIPKNAVSAAQKSPPLAAPRMLQACAVRSVVSSRPMGSGEVGAVGVDVLPLPPLDEPAEGLPAEEEPATALLPP